MPTDPNVANFVNAQRRSWADLVRQPVTSPHGPAHSLRRDISSEAARACGPTLRVRPSSSEGFPSRASGGVSPKNQQLRDWGPTKEPSTRRRPGESSVDRTLDSGGVALIGTDSLNLPYQSRDGAFQGRPPPGIPERQNTAQVKERPETIQEPLVDRKHDNEGGPLINFDSHDPPYQVRDGISQGRPPLGVPKRQDTSRGNGRPEIPQESPVGRNHDSKSRSLMDLHPLDPLDLPSRVQDHTSREDKQPSGVPKRQDTSRGNGRPETPQESPVDRTPDSESQSLMDLDLPDPPPQVQGRTSHGSGRLQKTKAQGMGSRKSYHGTPRERNIESEGGKPTNTDSPDPRPQVRERRSKPLQQTKVRVTGAGNGRSINPRDPTIDLKADSEIARHDSSDSSKSKDRSREGTSKSKVGAKSKRNTAIQLPPARRQTEPTDQPDGYARLLSEYTKISTEHTRASEESAKTTGKLEARLFQLNETLEEKDNQILELTAAISRLHQRDVEITKDDNYFATQFSDMASSIMQWVLTNFPRSSAEPISDVNHLPSPLREIVRMVIASKDENNFRSRDTRLRVISAVVADFLCRDVFRYGPYYLPSAQEATEALQVLGNRLQGNAFQCQRWRALTISLLAKGDRFESEFVGYVDMITNSLERILLVLIPPESERVRLMTGLHGLVDRAAKLSVEIRKQSDNIYLEPIAPGSPFISNHMEDVSCLLEDTELENATVQIQLFPAVLRYCCDSDGNISPQPGIVMKARVMAVNPFI